MDCDVFMSIGTSALVSPAAGLSERALRAGARIIEVNIESTDLTPFAGIVLRGRSGQLLPRLVALIGT